MRIAICDDLPEELERIRLACEEYFSAGSYDDVKIKTFSNPTDLLDEIERRSSFDIALLDICMPGITGITVAQEIRKKDEVCEIVFLSTSDEFYGEAFSVKALHYLIKPWEDAEFRKTLDKALRLINAPASKKVQINGDNGSLYALEINKIIYIEALKNSRKIYTMTEEYTETKRSLRAFVDELNEIFPGQFISPIRGYAVNLANVTSVSSDGVKMKDGTVIPIMRNGFKKIRDIFVEFSFSKEV